MFDERTIINGYSIEYLTSQKQGKSKLKIFKVEEENKQITLQLEFPSSSMSRKEMVEILLDFVNMFTDELKDSINFDSNQEQLRI
jgi:aspartate carbamoyltransferase regulatory subunit